MPMPTDFALRLASGLAAMLLLTSWRQVPPAFFRTVALVTMGLLVGAALAAIGGVSRGMMAALAGAAVLAYLASAFWGLGLPRVALPLTALLAIVGLGLMSWPHPGTRSAGPARFDLFDAGSRAASAALLGSTLASMLLGHHYLTAPAMSIDPLKRYVLAMAASLPVRSALAAFGLAMLARRVAVAEVASPLFLAMRWGMGVVGPAVAASLTWQTVKIRSTQSATGILYIAMTLVLFGELVGLILGRSAGIEL